MIFGYASIHFLTCFSDLRGGMVQNSKLDSSIKSQCHCCTKESIWKPVRVRDCSLYI